MFKEINFLCPICKKGILNLGKKSLSCSNVKCKKSFPIKNNVPILINETSSIFDLKDFDEGKITTLLEQKRNNFSKFLRRIIPRLGPNLSSRKNYLLLSKLVQKKSKLPKILVIGAGIEGKDFEIIGSVEKNNIYYTDVSFGPNTNIICDAHDLPFENSTFDAVISQAVLEHVADPYRCVDEFHRVLKKGGYVYAETPFMQQVHMAPYDFTRFTQLGHRRLFRKFSDIDSGVCCGPGMALAWAYQYFLLSFSERKIIRKFIKVFAAYTSFFLSYFDRYLIRKSGSFDAASAYYFLGSKSNQILSDKQIIKMYKGAGR